MIWYNIKELERLLITGKVSDQMTFKYLLASLILFTLVVSIPGAEKNPYWSQGIQLATSLFLLIWAFNKTFEINRQGDNREYFKRFICLTLVAGMRTLVFLFLISGIIVCITLFTEIIKIPIKGITYENEFFELVMSLIIKLFFYYVLLSSFKRINSEDSNGRELAPV